MLERQTTTQSVRERLVGVLAEWGAEISTILKELDEKRARVTELEAGATARGGELEALHKRLEGQSTLIETLQKDGDEAAKLRKDVRLKDAELERVNSELDSKKELIRALRRDAENVDRLKADSKVKDREIEELRAQLLRAEQRIQDGTKELSLLREAAAGKASEDSSELEALRSELEARKTLIKSLRADQERVGVLQSTLDEKREIIEQLEASINRHSGTIAELKRNADTWKRKYQAMKGESSTATTSVSLPSLSDTDVRTIEHLEKTVESKTDSTIAIDMRRSLLEARRAAASSGEK